MTVNQARALVLNNIVTQENGATEPETHVEAETETAVVDHLCPHFHSIIYYLRIAGRRCFMQCHGHSYLVTTRTCC